MFFKPKRNKEEENKNRRKFDRVATRNLVRILRDDGTELERMTNIYDLSEGGVRLVCHEALPPNTPLKIVLNLPDENAVLELSGRAAWTCPMKGQKGAFFIGIEFLDLKDKDRDLLRRVIARRVPGSA